MTINPKVAAGGIAGTVLTVIVGVLALLGVDIPDTVVIAAATIITFVVSWIKGAGDEPGDHAAAE